MSLTRDTLKNYAGMLLAIPLGVVATSLTTHMLGPQGRGMVAAAFVLPNVALTFGSLGYPSSASYFISRKKEDPSRVTATLLWSGIIIGTLLALILGGLYILFPKILPADVTAWQHTLVLAQLPMASASGLLASLYLYRRWFGCQALTQAMSPLTRILAVALVVFLIFPDASLSYQITAALGVLVLFSLFNLGSHMLLLRDWLKAFASFKLSLQMLRFGGIYTFAAGAMFFLHYGDQYLLGLMHPNGIYLLGIYTLAYTLHINALLAPKTLVGVFYRVSLDSSDEESDRLISLVGRRGLVVTFGVMLCLALLADPIIALLAPPEFAVAADILRILLLSSPAYLISELTSNASYSRGYVFLTSITPPLGLGLNILLNILWIPEYGMFGCAWATVLSFWLMAFMRWTIFAFLAGPAQASRMFLFSFSDLLFFLRKASRLWHKLRPLRKKENS